MNQDKYYINIEKYAIENAQQQKNEWRRKGWSIPDLRGNKGEWFSLVSQLVNLIEEGQANDLDVRPCLQGIAEPHPWRSYTPFLKSMGLAANQGGMLYLLPDGEAFQKEPTKKHLADLIQSKVRLFAEILAFIDYSAATVEEIHEQLCGQYNLTWKHKSNTRRRMDWLEVLGLIQNVGNRKWGITKEGKSFVKEWGVVSPQTLRLTDNTTSDLKIPEPPAEIAAILRQLADSPEMHKKRCTYNLWAPSPNRIENLRIIIQFALERIEKAEYYQFIEERFHLRASSVESMFPFLKAVGLIEEVGRNIYVATPIAKAWLETGSDLDFIRILHAHMQFVGEMLKVSEEGVVRNDMYAQAKEYGLNIEKARWIAGFLIEAGLLEEPQYLHLKTTPLGCAFADTLPLTPPSTELIDISDKKVIQTIPVSNKIDKLIDRLLITSKTPNAEGKNSGVAFEESIAEIFQFMGFEAKRIGGPGDTDVVVRWKDHDRKIITAIIDGKSKSGGHVSHSDVSDVAIDTHKEKHDAEYVAIIGPAFSGETIRNHAKKKSFALITATELGDIVRASQTLGLSLDEIALIFQVPDGLLQLAEIISLKKRELEVISIVIAKFHKEEELLGGLSPRDLFLLLRDTNVSPSLEELLNVFEILSKPEIGVLTVTNKVASPENIVYSLDNGVNSVNRLHALAEAVNNGLSS